MKTFVDSITEEQYGYCSWQYGYMCNFSLKVKIIYLFPVFNKIKDYVIIS